MPNKKLLKESFEKLCNELKNDLNGESIKNDITSNKGWDTIKNESFLKDSIQELKESNIRTSIFVDPDLKMIDGAKKIGSHRIELYTKSYADNFNKNPSEKELPIVFILLKLYQYIIILVGLIFGYVFSKKLKENQNNEPS